MGERSSNFRDLHLHIWERDLATSEIYFRWERHLKKANKYGREILHVETNSSPKEGEQI